MGFESFKNLTAFIEEPKTKKKKPRKSLFSAKKKVKSNFAKPKSLPRNSKKESDKIQLNPSKKKKYKISIKKRGTPRNSFLKKTPAKKSKPNKSLSKNPKKKKSRSKIKKTKPQNAIPKKPKLKIEVRESINQRVGRELAKDIRQSLENIDKNIGLVVENLSIADSEHKNSRRCSLLNDSNLLNNLKNSEHETSMGSNAVYNPLLGTIKSEQMWPSSELSNLGDSVRKIKSKISKTQKRDKSSKKKLKKSSKSQKSNLKKTRDKQYLADKIKNDFPSKSHKRNYKIGRGSNLKSNLRANGFENFDHSSQLVESNYELESHFKNGKANLTEFSTNDQTRGSGFDLGNGSFRGKSFLDWSQRNSGLTQSEVIFIYLFISRKLI